MDQAFTVIYKPVGSGWLATVPALPEVSALSEDRDTCRDNIRAAIRLYLEIHGSGVVQPIQRETVLVSM